MVRDLNGWIGDRVKAGITGAFGVSKENDNQRRVVKYYAERVVYVGNTYFEHKEFAKVHKGSKGPRLSGDNEHDRSSVSEERYAALCAGC